MGYRLRVDDNIYSVMVGILRDQILNGGNYTKVSNILVESLEEAYRDCSSKEIKALLNESSERMKSFYEYFARAHMLTLVYALEAYTRVAVHTRSPYMPLEIGLAWHPFLNLPYIPSSSIKGLLRSYMERNKASVCGLSVVDLFGSTERMGLLTVSDAMPIGCKDKLVEVEVMSPHYQESKGIIDEARVKPVPLLFPTLSPGVRLQLIVGLKELRGRDVQCIASELEELIEAAFYDGIGAKTSVGLGALTVKLQSRRGPRG